MEDLSSPAWMVRIPDEIKMELIADSISLSHRLTTIKCSYPLRLYNDLLVNRNLIVSSTANKEEVTSVITSSFFDELLIIFNQSKDELKQEFAYRLAKEFIKSNPSYSLESIWHLPFIKEDDWHDLKDPLDAIKLSLFRIDQQSFDSKKELAYISKDLRKLDLRNYHNKLIINAKWDVLGHVARSTGNDNKVCVFRGWISYLDLLETDTTKLSRESLQQIIKKYEQHFRDNWKNS